MRNCYRVPGNFRQHPRNALAAAGNAKPRPMPGQTHVDQGEGGPITSSSRDDSDCRTSKGSRRLAASGRAPSIGHREIKAVEPIRCGDPYRPARPLHPDTRFNRQRRYGGNGVGCCNACSGDPDRNGRDVIAGPGPGPGRRACHRMSRTQEFVVTTSPPPQRRDRLNRKYRTLKRRCRALNRWYGVLQRHSRSLNRKCATALAFQATSDTVPATRLPLPETPNRAQCQVRSMSMPEKASSNQFKQRLRPLPNLQERQPSLLRPGRDALIRHRRIKSRHRTYAVISTSRSRDSFAI